MKSHSVELLARTSSSGQDWKHYPKPWKFAEEGSNGGPGVLDANGSVIASLFWPTHPAEETAEAEQETYRLGRAIAALESRPVQQPAQLIAAQQAEDEGLWCIPKTAMEGHLQKELRRLTEAVEGKTSAECLRELLLKPPVQQPATEPESPIRLSDEQEAAVKLWGADDRLWTTQETVEFNLRTFARVALAARHVPVGTEEKK